MEDISKPEINNIVPRKGSTYMLDDLNDFNIIIKDNFSGVNHQDGLQFKLNEEEIIVGFNLYQNKLIANTQGHLIMGENQYELTVYDNANNKNSIKGHFFIKEN